MPHAASIFEGLAASVLDRRPVTVVGIVPADLAYLADVEAWTPFVPTPGDRANAFLQVFGRLAPGISRSSAGGVAALRAEQRGRLQPAAAGGALIG